MRKLPGATSEHAVGCRFLLGEVGDNARDPGSVRARVSVSTQS
jgi:hypothetical protein